MIHHSSNPWPVIGFCVTSILSYSTWTRSDDWTDVALVAFVSALVFVVASRWVALRLVRINFGQQGQLIVVADWGEDGREVYNMIPENADGIVFYFVPASQVESTATWVAQRLVDAGNRYFCPPPGTHRNRRLPILKRYLRDPQTGSAHETQDEYLKKLFSDSLDIDNDWMSYLREESDPDQYIRLFLASHRNGSVS